MLTNEARAAHQKIKDRISAAGINYPLCWDDMGSSEKDMWEEPMIRAINRLERKNK